jgi:hypothetical protein
MQFLHPVIKKTYKLVVFLRKAYKLVLLTHDMYSRLSFYILNLKEYVFLEIFISEKKHTSRVQNSENPWYIHTNNLHHTIVSGLKLCNYGRMPHG